MKGLAIVLLILLVVVTWLVARQLVRWRDERALRNARWAAAHRALPRGGVEIRLECPGEEPVRFGVIQPADPDFDQKLHEAMAEARARAAALNSER
jgi:hypothetical protein